MRKKLWSTAYLFFLLPIIGCEASKTEPFFLGEIPEEHIQYQTDSIIELGKRFFFDKALSLDNSIACASCHNPKLAFADTVRFSQGINNRQATRNSPSLFNVAFSSSFMGEGNVLTLEMQALIPLRDTNEMGSHVGDLIEELKSNAYYVMAAKKFFNRPLDAFVLTRSLSAYERSLTFVSRFDRFYYYKEENAISQQEKRGWKLFSEDLKCTQCHSLPNFTNSEVVYNGAIGDYLNKTDKGLYNLTNKNSDIGKFKVPSLRNITRTGPYMHDGSYQTIEEVLYQYQKGGKHGINLDKRISPFSLKKAEKEALISFLNSISEE
ncbi:MAG: cytochrome c peroxidase [Psychromonas sp.]|jgi:cytochrome c peroxidase